MTKPQPTKRPAIAVSPYLSLRQAVRPLIFAHSLLAREQGLSAGLAEECAKLEQLTREALEAAALVHLLAPDKTDKASDADSSRRSQVIQAYAKAGTTWAEVAGTAIALADALLDAGRPDDVHRLAGFLETAGEPGPAHDLHARADETARRIAHRARLGKIHANMTASEIAAAMKALREADDATLAGLYIREVAQSMLKLLAEEDYFCDSFESGFGYDPNSDVSVILTRWLVAPGDRVANGSVMCTYRLKHSLRLVNTYRLPAQSGDEQATITFTAIISRLLIPEGHEVSIFAPLAAIVRIPDPIAYELDNTAPQRRPISARLDALEGILRQI
jgi:hypothetical protein